MKSLEAGRVTLSFDDGWKCIYDNGFPLLEKAGVRSTHYIITGYLDPVQFPQYMNSEHILSLHRAGHEIGCHTVSHRHLPMEPDELVRDEIELSRKCLKKLGLPGESFAYPYGEYDDRVVRVVGETGFLCARSVIRGFNDRNTDPLLLKIQAVKVDTQVRQVSSWIDQALKDKTWLILMFHQVDHGGREWSTTPETLSQILGYIRDRNIEPVTVSGGMRLLNRQKVTPLTSPL